jgi:hypothetical protein
VRVTNIVPLFHCCMHIEVCIHTPYRQTDRSRSLLGVLYLPHFVVQQINAVEQLGFIIALAHVLRFGWTRLRNALSVRVSPATVVSARVARVTRSNESGMGMR